MAIRYFFIWPHSTSQIVLYLTEHLVLRFSTYVILPFLFDCISVYQHLDLIYKIVKLDAYCMNWRQYTDVEILSRDEAGSVGHWSLTDVL